MKIPIGIERIDLFIDGRFEPPVDERYFQNVNPATEEVIADVAIASSRDVQRAVLAARRAFDEGPWPRMRAAERATRLLNLADMFEEKLELFAKLETVDTGLPIMFTQGGHLPRTVAHFRYFAEETQRSVGEVYSMDDAYLNFTLREPIGVAALITPWNAPLSVASINVAAALACGNTCVLKPSEQTPLTAYILAQLAEQADFPPGVINVIQGPGDISGNALVAHPGVDALSFVGGTVTGRKVMQVASGGLKRMACELGGKSANIIFADADLERALEGALLCMFANNGEACIAGSRILVERPVYEQFCESFVARVRGMRVGDPLSFETEMGPMISKAHQEKIFDYINVGIKEGAVLRCGGKRPDDPANGFYVEPTVFSEVDNRMRIAQEEIFGPVAALIPFGDEDEAVAVANESIFGLAGYVWSRNVERALNVARQLRAGTISINAPVIRDIRAPFGGYKQSGLGRTGGRYSIELFTQVKTTCLPVNPFQFPRLGYSE